MKLLFFVLATHCVAMVIAEDSLAVESEANYQKIKRHHRDENDGGFRPQPYVKKYFRTPERSLAKREREPRAEDGGENGSWSTSQQEKKGPIYEFPPGYEVEGGRYRDEPKHTVFRYYPAEEEKKPEKVRNDEEKLKTEPSQHSGLAGTYLNHIKENIHDGKVLGFSSFVEHFSDNDDAEELKTAMREGSLDDIKKLVPKSGVSFQMYHGGGSERPVKVDAVRNEVRSEQSWSDAGEWHKPTPTPWSDAGEWHKPSPTPWTQPKEEVKQYVVHQSHNNLPGRKRMRKPERLRSRPHYHSEESRDQSQTTPPPHIQVDSPSPRPSFNEVYEHSIEDQGYPQIVPSISFEIPSQALKVETEGETVGLEMDRLESQPNRHTFTFDSEQGIWRPVSEAKKTVNTPKPPETSKLYYEHFKASKPVMNYQPQQDESDYTPKVGRIVVDHGHRERYTQRYREPESYQRRPLRNQNYQRPSVQAKRPTPASLASGEDFDQRYAQIPTSTTPTSRHNVTPQPTRWSKPDTTRERFVHRGGPSTPTVTTVTTTPPARYEKYTGKGQDGQIERPSGYEKESGNIFLTKEFKNEVSEFFRGGKSDFEWVPSTQIRYDNVPHGSSPVMQREEAPESVRSKRVRHYRSERVPESDGIVLIGSESSERDPPEFSVSASYKIDRNRKSGEDSEEVGGESKEA